MKEMGKETTTGHKTVQLLCWNSIKLAINFEQEKCAIPPPTT